MNETAAAAVDHPSHYNRGKIEVIRAVHAYAPDFSCGNALKYLCRAGDKPGADVVTDLQKAAWYLRDAIEQERKHWSERAYYIEPKRSHIPPFSIYEFLDDQGLTDARRYAAYDLMLAGEFEQGHKGRLPLLDLAYGYVVKAMDEQAAARTEAATGG